MKNKKQILIAKEKYSTRYFDASTPELLAESAFKLLKERWDDGYWRDLDDPPKDKDILSEEQIAVLPTENLRNSESQKRKEFLKEFRYWEESMAEYRAVANCIKNNLKNQAWNLLRNRSDYEYENVELETLE